MHESPATRLRWRGSFERKEKRQRVIQNDDLSIFFFLSLQLCTLNIFIHVSHSSLPFLPTHITPPPHSYTHINICAQCVRRVPAELYPASNTSDIYYAKTFPSQMPRDLHSRSTFPLLLSGCSVRGK